MNCRAVSPELATPGAYCTCCGGPARVPEADWMAAAATKTNCARGFVRNERFDRGEDQVIPGSNRAKQREWRKVAAEKRA